MRIKEEMDGPWVTMHMNFCALNLNLLDLKTYPIKNTMLSTRMILFIQTTNGTYSVYTFSGNAILIFFTAAFLTSFIWYYMEGTLVI